MNKFIDVSNLSIEPRRDRKIVANVKTYTIFDPVPDVIKCPCDVCMKLVHINDIFVKMYKQKVSSENLGPDDVRNICIDCWKKETKLNRQRRKNPTYGYTQLPGMSDVKVVNALKTNITEEDDEIISANILEFFK
jgi:hypothetical protein